MSRRTIKKCLRKAEEALLEGRFEEARQTYSELLASFDSDIPSLLDHAACIYGLIKALYALNEDRAAMELGESAVELLAVHQELEVAA